MTMSVLHPQNVEQSPGPPTPRHTRGAIRAGRAIAALALREMITTHGRSPGGWIWSVMEPVAAIALLSFAFSLAFRAPPLGTSFPLFYASGFLVYMTFHDISQKTATAIRFSKPLFSFGAVTCVDAILARIGLNALTHVIVMVLVLGGILALDWPGAPPDPAGLALAFAMATALAGGIGVLNCYLFTAFPVWDRLWSIALRPLFIVSGVVFVFEDAPRAYHPILAANPLFHVTGQARAAIYPTYEPTYISLTFVFAVAAAAGVLGLLLLNRFHDDLIHK